MELRLTQISFNFQTFCCNIKIRDLGAKRMWLFYYFNSEGNYDSLKPKSECILLNKNANFNKNETELKTFRQTLCFISYKNCKFKVKLWWVGTLERKKRIFFLPFSLSEGNFFNTCFLSQCILYWIHLQYIHIFTYEKTLLHILLWLFLKSSKALSVS